MDSTIECRLPPWKCESSPLNRCLFSTFHNSSGETSRQIFLIRILSCLSLHHVRNPISHLLDIRFSIVSSCRIAYDKLVTDFEALECLRTRKRDRDACEEKTLPDDGSEAYSAELAAEDYLAATPAGQQTRNSVRLDGACICLKCCSLFLLL